MCRPRAPFCTTVAYRPGLGGLCCAAMLARYGRKVAIFEAHYAAGGVAHTFKRDGYTFDSGPSFHAGLSQRPSLNPLKHVLDAIDEEVCQGSARYESTGARGLGFRAVQRVWGGGAWAEGGRGRGGAGVGRMGQERGCVTTKTHTPDHCTSQNTHKCLLLFAESICDLFGSGGWRAQILGQL